MEVFGLPRHVTRGAGLASRLLAAKPFDSEASIRRDTVARGRRTRDKGLSAAEAAAVGMSRTALYRWEKHLEARSHRACCSVCANGGGGDNLASSQSMTHGGINASS